MWHKMLEQLPDHEYKIDENKEKNIMNPEEFAKEMKNIQEKEWTESAHIAMDELMCKVLCQLGYKKGIEIFVNTKKWYS